MIVNTNQMALRDWFAGQALIGLLARPDVHPPVSATVHSSSSTTLQQTDTMLAEHAYRLADAMIKAGGHPAA